MTERDLESLRDLRAPAPRPDARRRAIDAAMQQFNAQPEKLETFPKEDGTVVRLTRAFDNRKRLSMFNDVSKQVAASLVVLAIGIPTAVHVVKSRSPVGDGKEAAVVVAQSSDKTESRAQEVISGPVTNTPPASPAAVGEVRTADVSKSPPNEAVQQRRRAVPATGSVQTADQAPKWIKFCDALPVALDGTGPKADICLTMQYKPRPIWEQSIPLAVREIKDKGTFQLIAFSRGFNSGEFVAWSNDEKIGQSAKHCHAAGCTAVFDLQESFLRKIKSGDAFGVSFRLQHGDHDLGSILLFRQLTPDLAKTLAAPPIALASTPSMTTSDDASQAQMMRDLFVEHLEAGKTPSVAQGVTPSPSFANFGAGSGAASTLTARQQEALAEATAATARKGNIALAPPPVAPQGQGTLHYGGMILRSPNGVADTGQAAAGSVPPAAMARGTDSGNYGSRFRFTGDARVSTEADRDVPRRHGSKGGTTQHVEAKRAELQQLEQRYHGGYLRQPADHDKVVHPPVEQSRDQFDPTPPSPVKQVAQEPVSTFSIDVDTASYAFARRAINGGRLPPREAVRVEEMINYFPYAYPRPETSETPFRPTVTVLPSPWTPTNKLIHIGIKGYDLKSADRPRANLVFLVDVSGSMQPADRLPLLKNAFRMLLDNLQPEDTVAIVTYASGSDIRLKPTKVADKLTIIQAIDSLGAGGSTHGAAGINDAYKVAEASFDRNAVNRVILATDGDWNVGITDRGELQKFVERKRETGIYLSIFGVGMGNHNDRLMQTLAQNGNGVAAYIDTLNEARKVLVDEASSTLFPIAKDVKIQIEFNPARVASYRLIGYETRALRREDFNNDKVDAGDIGAGHTVTAIYEITPVGAPGIVDGLRYKQDLARPASGQPGSDRAPLTVPTTDAEYAFLKMRYKLPKEDTSKLMSVPITGALERSSVAEAPDDVRFSVAVAAFGQLLRGGTHLGSFGYDEVIALANSAKGPDPFGYRAEMINLARLAKSAPR